MIHLSLNAFGSLDRVVIFRVYGGQGGLILGLAITAIVAAVLRHHRLSAIGRYLDGDPVGSLITGLLAVLVSVSVVLLLAGAVPLLAGAVGLVFGIAVAVGVAVISQSVGYHLGSRISALTWVNQSPWKQLLLGYLVFALSQSVPLLGDLVSLSVAVLGVGSVIKTRFGRAHAMTVEERG